MKPYYNLLLACLLIFLSMTGCSHSKNDAKNGVFVSIPPQAYIAKKIAGDKIPVNTFLAQGANPETYEPSLSKMLELNNSVAYLTMGNIGFEEEVIDKIKDTAPNLKVINVSQGIEMLHGTHSSECSEHTHHSDIDPHTWSSIVNARIIAKNTCDVLCEIDPDNKEYFTDNLKKFMIELDSLDTEIRNTLASTNVRRILVWHPSLSYFARDYNLEQIALGMENKEMSAASLKTKIDQAANGDNITLLLQRDYDPRVAEVVNKEIGANVAYINPLNPDWGTEMINTARAIAGKK